jgi:hypothetical protein
VRQEVDLLIVLNDQIHIRNLFWKPVVLLHIRHTVSQTQREGGREAVCASTRMQGQVLSKGERDLRLSTSAHRRRGYRYPCYMSAPRSL